MTFLQVVIRVHFRHVLSYIFPSKIVASFLALLFNFRNETNVSSRRNLLKPECNMMRIRLWKLLNNVIFNGIVNY